MLDRHLACLFLVMCAAALPASVLGEQGYYKGGTISWEPSKDDPREGIVKFKLFFDTESPQSYRNHERCEPDDVIIPPLSGNNDGKKLKTGGWYKIGENPAYGKGLIKANYNCIYRDQQSTIGVWKVPYSIPSDATSAPANYAECCWIPGLLNNGRVISSGRGWNLASLINIDHGDPDGTPNLPPTTRTFPMYFIMSGCNYKLRIDTQDANNDEVKCRWTDLEKEECKTSYKDFCGEPSTNEARTKPLAKLSESKCTLSFKSEPKIPPGDYAMMVMLEDYAPSAPNTPISKTPVHFIVKVFHEEGECRQPSLRVPDDICLAHVVGQEFRMRMIATATAPEYSITSIQVTGFPTGEPTKVPDTDSDYEITFSFTPTEVGTTSICAMAYEENRFASDQSCPIIDVVEEGDMPLPLEVDPNNSIPAQAAEEGEQIISNWSIKFSRKIQRGVFSPAYVTVRDADGTVVWQIDATDPEAVAIKNNTLTFPNAHKYLQLNSQHTISLQRGVVQSNDDDCSVSSVAVEWSFKTKERNESGEREPPILDYNLECSSSSMVLYMYKKTVDQYLYKMEPDQKAHGPEIMHLRDRSCVAFNASTAYYAIWTRYGSCGTIFKRNGTDFVYSNVVYIPEAPYQPEGTEVTRVPHNEFRFSCSIPAKTVKTLTFNPKTQIGVIGNLASRASHLDGLVDTTLKLFEDETYSVAAASSSNTGSHHPVDVSFGTRLYFQAKVPARCSGGSQCDLFIQSCWAGTSDNPYDWPRHKLIEEGCEVDNTVQLHDSGVSHKARFSVDAFAFLGWRILDTVYIHCNVFVCPSDNEDCKTGLGCRHTPAHRAFEELDRRGFVISSPGFVRMQ